MPILDQTQTARAIKAMEAYLSAPADKDSKKTPVQEGVELDQRRRALIAERLMPALNKFFDGSMPLADFKPEIDRLNKQNEFWGFKGIKGQMFFNLIFNACLDENELVSELKSALACPTNEDMAKSRIRNFASYVRRIGDDHVTAGNSKASRPKPSSIPFFLSYFWQVKAPDRWPVFFTNISATSTTYWSPAAVLQEWHADGSGCAGRAWIGLIDRHATPNPITTNLGLC